MLCDECGKNKATVHLTEIVNDQISKLNLCEACAKERGQDVEQHFGIADLLAALSDAGASPAQPAAAGASHGTKTKCSHCGLTYEDFKKIGRLGCGACYQVFRPSLTALLKRIHGSTQHLGKSPSPSQEKEYRLVSRLQEDLEAAKKELSKAVNKEEFEEAASLRDKIKFLEKKLKEASKGVS